MVLEPWNCSLQGPVCQPWGSLGCPDPTQGYSQGGLRGPGLAWRPWPPASSPGSHPPALSRQRFTSKQDVIRHYNMHKKRDNSLQHGFMRFSPLDDCSVYYHGCHLNGKSTHYHCMQVPPAPAPAREPPFLPSQVPGQGDGGQVASPGGSGAGSGGWARAGPSPWPYLVWVKCSELFIQTDIFQALTPRAALPMVPEEVFV